MASYIALGTQRFKAKRGSGSTDYNAMSMLGKHRSEARRPFYPPIVPVLGGVFIFCFSSYMLVVIYEFFLHHVCVVLHLFSALTAPSPSPSPLVPAACGRDCAREVAPRDVHPRVGRTG